MTAPAARSVTRQLDLKLLELFDSVFKTRNLSASGVQLGLSQPAVSYGLARLRELYGDALFVRMRHGVSPTPFAEQLAQPVGTALQILRGTVERAPFEPERARRTFRIAMSDIGERFFLPRLSSTLAESAPGVDVETLSPGLGELRDGLASGDIDLAVGFVPDLGKQVHERVLFGEHYVYLARSRHPGLRQGLSATALRQLRHVVASPPGTQHAAAVERVLTSARVRARISLRVRSFLCVGPIVAESDLVSVVPSNLGGLIAREHDLQLVPPPVAFPGFAVSLYWHQRFHQEPGLAWVRSVFQRLFTIA